MGLPLRNNMNNLHAPTVHSGPTSAPATNGHTPTTFPELQRKKQNLEEELKALSGVLDSVRLFHNPLLLQHNVLTLSGPARR